MVDILIITCYNYLLHQFFTIKENLFYAIFKKSKNINTIGRKTMKRKIFCFFIIALLIANFSVKINYIIEVKPLSTESVVYLPTEETISLTAKENIVIEGFKKCKIYDHIESNGWSCRAKKAKRKFSLSLRRTEALPIYKFCGLTALIAEKRKKTKILLFSPELIERTYPGRPPIYYLSAHLKRNGFTTVACDVDILGRNKFIKLLLDFKPDIIAGTSLSVQINETMELIEILKSHCPKAITILGGSHATAAGKYLFPIHFYLDAAVAGEGLNTIVEIAEAVETNNWSNRKSEIKGLIYWNGKNSIQNRIVSLAPLSNYNPELPYHTSYDFSVFIKPDGTRAKTFQIMTAFGCNNNCFFCNSSTKRGKEKRMDISTVEMIIRNAVAKGYEAVYFDDDTFTRDINYAINVARICKKYRIIFGCHTRPDCENEFIIREFASCGCKYIFSGLESAADEILLGANKTQNPIMYREAYLKSYKLKRELGLPSSAFMIHGMPRKVRKNNNFCYLPDRLEDSKKSIDFAVWKLDPTFLSMNVLRFLPGVPFSNSSLFEFMRPAKGKLHGGYWDKKWLMVNGIKDPRSFHPILRAFEGSGSCIPTHMTPKRCYRILSYAVNTVNKKNRMKQCKNQTKIVVDPWFEENFLQNKWDNGKLYYELAPFNVICS